MTTQIIVKNNHPYYIKKFRNKTQKNPKKLISPDIYKYCLIYFTSVLFLQNFMHTRFIFLKLWSLYKLQLVKL